MFEIVCHSLTLLRSESGIWFPCSIHALLDALGTPTKLKGELTL
jgi:hypothetical protein